MLDTRVPVTVWRSQPMQQNMTQAPPASADAPPADPPAPPATPPAPPADDPLGPAGLRALQAERDNVARLTAELAAAKAAPQPPATGGDVANEVAQLRKDLESERAARALADAGVEHSLSKTDLAIVGDFGTPTQIAARAKALKDRLTAAGATPQPGLPASPNAHRQNGTTGFGSVAAARDEYLAKRTTSTNK